MHIAYKFPKEKRGGDWIFAGPKNSSDLLGVGGGEGEKHRKLSKRIVFAL